MKVFNSGMERTLNNQDREVFFVFFLSKVMVGDFADMVMVMHILTCWRCQRRLCEGVLLAVDHNGHAPLR